MNRKLLSSEVQKFIKDHQNDDPFLLSLKAKKSDNFPLTEAIEQIQSRQKAKFKLSSWLSTDGILWPSPISIEQSSSEATAKYKAGLIHGKSLVDLTGGMGIDAFYFADRFEKVSYVEPNEKLSQLAAHNFRVLGKKNIENYTQRAEEFLDEKKGYFDAIFLDPSRRSEDKKVFKIEDCTPNLYEIVPQALEICDKVLVKLSPLVDLSLLIRDFNPTAIWVVAVKGEVKEVLGLIQKEQKVTKIHAIDLQSIRETAVFEFDWDEEVQAESEFSLPLQYIYEPNAAIMKTGAFKLVGKKYKIKKLHQHTHLYTSDEFLKDFPGKVLEYRHQIKQNKKELLKAVSGKKINVITRNFPLSAAQLKKKHRIKDGGSDFLIGTTLIDGKKVLLLCDRLN